MTEARIELPENVGVQTVTFVVYSDGRPTEIMSASTEDDMVGKGVLTKEGDRLFAAFVKMIQDPALLTPLGDVSNAAG